MSEDKLSIKINIADRFYPIKISAADEEKVRAAARLINQNVERYRTIYAGRDVQDALSITCIQFVLKLQAAEQDNESNQLIKEIQGLDSIMQDYLSKNPEK